MIPRKIHYCWFGRAQMPSLAIQCIDSWKKYLSDYELILWNEANFDIRCNRFVLEAYESKKYAFVTDYVRLHALYHYGGIYMDTDIEVIKRLDRFLEHSFFIGCEREDMIQTGLIGSKPNSDIVRRILNYYDDKKFILDDGSLNLIPNPQVITPILRDEYGWIPQNKYQVLTNGISVYPIDYFCAKDWNTGKVYISSNTYTIHHFSGSWLTKTDKLKNKIKTMIGPKSTQMIVDLKKKMRR